MKVQTFSVALLTLAAISGAASAAPPDVIATSSGNQWVGFYAGVNGGGAFNSTCSNWEPRGAIGAAVLNSQSCPNNSTGIGGVQIGYNFQSDQWVWGFGLDYEFWSAKNRNRTATYTGAPPPPNGTYTFSGKANPNGMLILGPRIAYAFDQWLPYLRAGGVFTTGSTNSTASFTDANGTAVFAGGRDYKANGFGIGVGVDYQFSDPWSLRLDYTYINLGKGSNSNVTCSPAGSAVCAEFGSVTLDNSHNSLTANIVRFGINYKF
jgi:outer membrane immunogenic protein